MNDYISHGALCYVFVDYFTAVTIPLPSVLTFRFYNSLLQHSPLLSLLALSYIVCILWAANLKFELDKEEEFLFLDSDSSLSLNCTDL
jgi:hypothetical protein